MLFYQILAYAIKAKIYKSHIRTINFKYQFQHEMKNFDYLMDQKHYIFIKLLNQNFRILNYDCNGTRTHKPLVCKRTLNHLD